MKNSTLKQILFYLKRHWLKFTLVLIMSLGFVASSLSIPIFVGKCIDAIITDNVNFAIITQNAINILFLIVIAFFFQWLIGVLNNQITYDIVKDIRKDAFNKITKTSLNYIDTHAFGDVLSHVITDVDTFADGLLMGFTELFTGIFTMIGAFVLMLIKDWIIALFVVGLTPLSFVLAKFISSKINKYFVKQTMARADESSFVDEMINNLKVVKAFHHEEKNNQKFDVLNKDLSKTSLKAVFFSSLVNPSTRLINAIIYAIVCLIGCLVIIYQPMGLTLTIGVLSSLLAYSKEYMKPFNDISNVFTELQNAYVCAKNVFEIINLDDDLEKKDAKKLENVNGKIDIDHVDFSYNKNQKLIVDLNLHVKKGMRVAIVGPTGAGKTTIINLLMRFYDADSGTIKVDDKNVLDITKNSLRKNYGMVLQETWLKYGTIMENLKMGKPDATDEEVIKVSKETYAHNFIVNLPKGYDTIIGDGKIALSVGEMQLLCITRIMLLMPPMLILDEATSSIDTRTELKIQSAFYKLMKGKTSFIVAHRLSTIKESDIILVLNNGQIVEQGNHEELLSKKGFYYSLYNSQFENT